MMTNDHTTITNEHVKKIKLLLNDIRRDELKVGYVVRSSTTCRIAPVDIDHIRCNVEALAEALDAERTAHQWTRERLEAAKEFIGVAADIAEDQEMQYMKPKLADAFETYLAKVERIREQS